MSELPPEVAEKAKFAGRATLIVAALPLIIGLIIVLADAVSMLGPVLYGMLGGGVLLGVLGVFTLRGMWIAPVLSGVLLALNSVVTIVSVFLGGADVEVALMALTFLGGAAWMIQTGRAMRRGLAQAERG